MYGNCVNNSHVIMYLCGSLKYQSSELAGSVVEVGLLLGVWWFVLNPILV